MATRQSAPKTLPTQVSVADHIAARATPAQQADCQALMALLQRLTGEPPAMWGPSIVGFGAYTYSYASGQTGDWPIAGFSPRKQALTVYLVPGFDRDEAMMAKLGKHTTSKACLYIKRLSDIDMKVLEHLVKASVRAMASVRIRAR